MNGEKLKVFALGTRTRQICSLSPLLFQHNTGISSQRIKSKERKKRVPNRKRGSQIVPLIIRSYIQKNLKIPPRDSQFRHMNSVSLYDTKSMYKNSVAFLYINNDLAKKNLNVIYNSYKNKIHRNKFTQEVKDFYKENYKTFTEKTDDGSNRKTFHSHELEELLSL